MFSVAALMPAPPVLVPELCGGAAEPGVPALRAAVLDALGALAAESGSWTVLGTGRGQYGPDTVGTFRGYGVDLTVALGPDATAEPDPELELPVLIAAWARGAAAPGANAEVRLLPEETSARAAADFGARLRAELDATPEPRGVLLIADGAATLTTASPGYLDERAPAVQRALDTALATGDRAVLLELDPALCADLVLRGRVGYQALAGLLGRDGAVAAETRFQGAPFGVGYHAGLWRPA
ncbi:hypothetical protein [Nocardia jiangsuensis]|uniref:Uncharacterized protein n=1 Tax=Nocardia jiangsuensis TaxID=1691563 RepID=A0ABV8DQA5_9NOCA